MKVSVCCLEAGVPCGLPWPVIVLQICSDSVAAKTFCAFDMLSVRPEERDVKGEEERSVGEICSLHNQSVFLDTSVIC